MGQVFMFGGKERYEWVWPQSGERRSPDDYPYNHDDYWLWHDALNERRMWAQVHSDRMFQHYGEAFSNAKRKHIPTWQNATKAQVTAFLEEIMPGRGCVATGLAAGVNHGNGAPIYTIFYRAQDNASSGKSDTT
ncbi:hypothetical protein [Rhizobium phage RHEph12]|nr:hypothetical protein [Rhizobium phage RHEph12]